MKMSMKQDAVLCKQIGAEIVASEKGILINVVQASASAFGQIRFQIATCLKKKIIG